MSELNRVETQYRLWLQDPVIDDNTKRELRAIEDQSKEIEDRFYRDLEFGTGGLRGVIGAGTNRINVYTIGRATQGLAQYLLRSQAGARSGAEPSVVIAHDSRHMSPEFALEAALVLAGNGVKAYVFDALRPTPELSFAVRELDASAGIVVTASHNPPEYNGYKVYGPDGGQIVPQCAEQVLSEVDSVQSFDQVKRLTRQEAEQQGLLRWIGKEIDDNFVSAVTSVSQHADAVKRVNSDFHIVFTPLHGSGNIAVRSALRAVGFDNVHVVTEQELPDPNFSTVKSPNPEEREAFNLAIEQAGKVGADIIIGTDPDCDRMGAVVKDANGNYFVLTGNQSGAIMLHYLLSGMKERNALPTNGVVIKTIVTSEMGAVIAASYDIPTLNTLTGFKYIGEKITQFEQSGEYTYLFGYEESYGYLAGTHARDKDAVVASMLICEAAAYYKSQGKTLYDVMEELYATYGYFMEKLESKTLKGKDGLEQIARIMEHWRAAAPSDIAGVKVAEVEDYSQGLHGLPQENVLKFKLADHSWFCLRPSGTEPKIKFYFAVKGASEREAAERLETLSQAVLQLVEKA